ncbi:MAG: heme exporter protein CcmB [Anaerolineales bacterium]|nr:heme exporter protein CcmB [Anaerolineales bacterium]MCB0009710.1 heme exporter protein CcmB [Anaerolineales bacterium]MCB0014043.1 heme exporter protein CcmB [Anaerolineales bacterium]MCB0017676.1 heme exporter protein CcmB [Anaerolineales bacterium]MCB8960756.1 heme exporter protein CcmB [Ardenticatenales bacterium]
MSYWGTVWAIVRKDLQIERRTRQTVSLMLMFAVSIVVMFNFALEAKLDAVQNVATGLLWAAIMLAGTLGLNRSIDQENENQAIDAILIAPVERSAIYVGKVISVYLFVLFMDAILILIFIVAFGKPLYRPPALLLILLGSFGYVAAGVLVTSITIQTRARSVLLPVLLLPLILPLVLSAASGVASFMVDTPPELAEVTSNFAIVAAYDLLMLTVGVLTYNYVVEG